jgi:hypothetical protein
VCVSSKKSSQTKSCGPSSTVPNQETTTSEQGNTTTTNEETSSCVVEGESASGKSAVEAPPSCPETLPFTGIPSTLWVMVGIALLATGRLILNQAPIKE